MRCDADANSRSSDSTKQSESSIAKNEKEMKKKNKWKKSTAPSAESNSFHLFFFFRFSFFLFVFVFFYFFFFFMSAEFHPSLVHSVPFVAFCTHSVTRIYSFFRFIRSLLVSVCVVGPFRVCLVLMLWTFFASFESNWMNAPRHQNEVEWVRKRTNRCDAKRLARWREEYRFFRFLTNVRKKKSEHT